MTRYVIRRLLILPVVLIGLSLLIFIMLQALDPAERAALYVSSPPKNPRALQDIVQKYGLDQPVYLQYIHWLNRVIHGDLGWSKTAQMPVLSALKTYFPATFELALWSFIPILVGGVWLGIQAALHHDSFIDQAARVFSIVGYSFPTFVFGLLVLMIFYAALHWFPPGRLSDWATTIVYSPEFHRYTGMNTVDALLNLRFDIFANALSHLLLPALTLAYVNWALILRVTRSSMLDVIRQDYVTVARAKGLSERQVINRHARPNAMIPVATIGGLLLVGLLNGVVITETVFDYHGMGWWAANAALNFDAVSVLGITLFDGGLLVLANLFVDVMYAYLDPRIRLE
ncbi:MAG: ABC transporter permease [Ardenticatenaceae bacterium]|nr:ABC transporter permease [Ardenticatenaceae bacterium]HBY97858.1 peptide ABC transporter permease [Chloroflexota bacterium]